MMAALEFPRRSGEPAQDAFERAELRVMRLHARGYSAKFPTRPIRPGQFALESLPNSGGWKITVSPLPGHSSEEIAG